MAADKNNQGQKVLNVPNKREQSQACLGYAEREGLRPQGNVPNLRFPEFEGEWEKIRVSDLLEFYSTNSLSWEQLEYGEGEVKNLHYGIIHVGLPTLVNIEKNTLPTIKDGNVPKNYTLCENGDIVFADASEDTDEVAKAVEFVNVGLGKVVAGLHTIHGRDINDKTVLGFKGYAFASPAFHYQIRRIAQGTKIYSISGRNFTECYIGIPSKAEQAKIADLLRLIDERIITQNKIIDKLKSLIKGLAERLTQIGEPNVCLSHCLECHTSSLQESDVSESGIYPVYGATGISGYRDDYSESSEAILIVKDGSGVGTVSYTNRKFSVIGTLNYLTAKNDYYLLYLYYALMAFNFTPYRTGMAIPHIYFKDYGKSRIFCPATEQQHKVASLLYGIEKKIEVEQQILNQLNSQKFFLLRSMFI